ncbi:MAG: hypothetical protein KAR07_09220, partial [Spirochaetes bacterium]|nr:hypothetical protein [Spirochaetota bacterium]
SEDVGGIRTMIFESDLGAYLKDYPSNLVVDTHLDQAVCEYIAAKPECLGDSGAMVFHLKEITGILIEGSLSPDQYAFFNKRKSAYPVTLQPAPEILLEKEFPGLCVISEPTIGDMFTIGRLLNGLKKIIPQVSIHFVVSEKLFSFAKNFKGIDEVCIYAPETVKRLHDVADITVNYMHSGATKPGVKKPEIYADRIFPAPLKWQMEDVYVLPPEEKKAAEKYINKLRVERKKKLIGVAPFAVNDRRSWTEENTRKFTERLRREGYELIILHSEKLFHIDGVLWPEDVPYELLPAIVSCLDGLVSVDTGFVHLAVAVKTPVLILSIGISGESMPTRNERFINSMPTENCPCFFEHDCQPALCRELLSPDKVFDAFSEWMNEECMDRNKCEM